MTSTKALRQLLLPLSPLYRLALWYRDLRLRRGWEPVRRLVYPVVSIGNLSTGGAGKTPFVVAVAEALTVCGFAVDVLSRGYGRRTHRAARVDPNGTSDQFGDEPLLIARRLGIPVYVAAQRYQAGLLAEAEVRQGDGDAADGRPRIHLLDDAFQHRQLHREVDILLLNHDDWSDRLLPAGNLREPLRAAYRASVIAIPDEEEALEGELRAWGWDGPVWRMRRRMAIPPLEGPVFAFCGIARPGQFLSGLRTGGVRLAGTRIFRDHHRYTAGDLVELQRAARASGAVALLTTEKDHVRLNTLSGTASFDLPVLTAGLQVQIENRAEAMEWLVTRAKARPGVSSL